MLRFIAPVCVLFVALSLTATNSEEPVYRAVGDEVELTPGPVSDPITVITWRHGQDVAMEWINGSVESFRQFKERGDISGTTGALTITGLTPGDSGNYTAEINHKETRTTQLQVISCVSKPTVSTQWDTDNTYCVFTCESNTTNAEPVTYSWISQEKSWDSRKEITIGKEESETWFHCELSNPVSTEVSETVQNPFSPWKWHHTVIIVILILLILAVGLSFYFYKKRNEGKELQESLSSASCAAPQSGSSGPASRSELVNRLRTSMIPDYLLSGALVGCTLNPKFHVSSETGQKDDWRPTSESTSGRSNPVSSCRYTKVDQGSGSDGPGGAEPRPENEETSVIPSVPDSLSQDPPVQEQAADLPDET